MSNHFKCLASKQPLHNTLLKAFAVLTDVDAFDANALLFKGIYGIKGGLKL
jgi:hypothetical protein